MVRHQKIRNMVAANDTLFVDMSINFRRLFQNLLEKKKHERHKQRKQ